MTVAELLTASRASHAAYRTAHDTAVKAKQKKPSGWQVCLWDAFWLRSKAHTLDPQHLDPAWGDDKASNTALMAFYEKQLGLKVLEDGESAARR